MSVHLVRGDDPVLRDEALGHLLDELVAGEDRALAVEELWITGRASPGEADVDEPTGAEGREAVVAAALNAAQSPPFMTERRVVVLRDVGNLATADAEPLVRYLDEPMETTALVLVAGGARTPANLTKALKQTKAVEVSPTDEQTDKVLTSHFREAGIKLKPGAIDHLKRHLGDEPGRVPSLVDLLISTYGKGATLDIDDIVPYEGEAGSVPSYQLTNAIESGDIPRALETLRRMRTSSGPRQPKPLHPLQVLGTLHRYYRRLLALDSPAVQSAKEAMAVLGGRSNWAAQKALEQVRALRTDGIRQAYEHLAQADLDLKGARAIPEDAILEVLVARLAQLSGRARRASG